MLSFHSTKCVSKVWPPSWNLSHYRYLYYFQKNKLQTKHGNLDTTNAYPYLDTRPKKLCTIDPIMDITYKQTLSTHNKFRCLSYVVFVLLFYRLRKLFINYKLTRNSSLTWVYQLFMCVCLLACLFLKSLITQPNLVINIYFEHWCSRKHVKWWQLQVNVDT